MLILVSTDTKNESYLDKTTVISVGMNYSNSFN